MADEFNRIRDPSQLAGLNVRRMLSWRSPRRIMIEAAGTPLERVHEWERRLSRLQGACGCEQGGVGLILGLAGYLLFLLLRPGGWGDPGRVELWVGVAVLSVTSTAGKVVGLRLAQRELQRTAREIRAQWVTRQPAGSPPGGEAPRSTGGKVHRSSRCCGRPLPRPTRKR